MLTEMYTAIIFLIDFLYLLCLKVMHKRSHITMYICIITMFGLYYKVVMGSLLVVAIFTEENVGIKNEQTSDEDNDTVIGERQKRGAVTNIINIKIGLFEEIKCERLVPHGRKVQEAANDSKSLVFDCQSIQDADKTSSSGVYTIYPRGTAVKVYCDMETDGGGWTVIQRRIDGIASFQRTWNEYKNGFGNASTDYWLGNENIHTLTNNGTYKLRIDMKDSNGNVRYAKYDSFKISNETGKYRLTIGSKTGNALDNSMATHNGQSFSTKDQDNDASDKHCSTDYAGSGGWWYNNCYQANLNGAYYQGKSIVDASNRWNYLVYGSYLNLRMSEMKIRYRP